MILVGKSERRRGMWRNLYSWKYNIKINLKERLWDIVDWRQGCWEQCNEP